MTKKIVVSLLVIIEIISIFLLYKTRPVEDIVLEDVKLKEEAANNNGFALMLETENADGTTSYVESSSSTWPTDMVFNSENSGCVDVNGNIIEGALSFDNTNNIMNVSVGETAYCYVYFDIKRYCNKNEPLGECLLRKNSEIDNLNDNIEGGLYRYQGTETKVTDNYVCFGTSDKNTCLNDTDTYMYRIIGIDENGQMKLIKNTSIGRYMWHSDYTSNISWPESDLFAYLNGNDSIYVPVGWESKITTTSWKYGDETTVNKTASELYVVENNWTNIESAKIGLIYAHDYFYAYQSGGLNCSASGSYSTCKTAWIFLGSNEWTMSRYAISDSYYDAYVVNHRGYVYGQNLSYTNAVRPVFFLTSDVEYLMGTGTIVDPFIINN